MKLLRLLRQSIFVLVLIFSLNTFAYSLSYSDSSYSAFQRCHRIKNPFVLNIANINALMALSCTALSHVENEKRQMNYEDSNTLFHQWQVVRKGNRIEAEGFCALPYAYLKEEKMAKYSIAISFEIPKDVSPGKIAIKSNGSAAGKKIELQFDSNEFLDDSCSSSEVITNKLRIINLGMGLGMDAIVDMLKSGTTGVVLSLMGDEHWVQGNVSSYFSGLGLQYRMTQINGRRIGMAVAPSPSSAQLHIRTAAALDFFEGGEFFQFRKDSFNLPVGFLNQSLPVNSKFQAYSIEGGSEVRGCTSLIYEGELDYPDNIDMENCYNRIEKSPLSKYSKGHAYKEKIKEQTDEEKRRIAQAQLVRKISDFLNKRYGVLKNYSKKPNLFETGKARWQKEDIQRGYVIYQRSFEITGKTVSVVEYHYDVSGASKQKKYLVPLKDIN